MHAAHSIFGQKLLQVHVLKLEEAPIFYITWGFGTLVSLYGVLQEGFQTRHRGEMPPCERACRLGTTSKLCACTSWDVGVRKLGELPGHPGPDGVVENTGGTQRGVAN